MGDLEIPLGTSCRVDFPPASARIKTPTGGDIGIGRNPFCIAWTDIYQDETGFRVVLKYNGGEEFIYRAGANVNEVFPPPSDWPDNIPPLPPDLNAPGILGGFKRKDIEVMVYALTSGGEVLIDGFALTVQ